MKRPLRVICVLSLLAGLGAGGPASAQDRAGPDVQISEFVRRIFQDDQGNMWFGTNGDGVIRFDGANLRAFGVAEGFGGHAVRGIAQGRDGDLWFATSGGLTRYDGTHFTNYTEQDGLAANDAWSLAIDREGVVWVGTLQGVSRFDGEGFTPFDLPESAPDPTRGVTSARVVHSIMQDSRGRLWFGTNGGAYVWDGATLTNISTADGLCHDVVNDILEDRQGRFWFATHHAGVCRLEGSRFTHVTAEAGIGDGREPAAPVAPSGPEVWSLFEDSAGRIWFPVEGQGVYRFDGDSWRNFTSREGLGSPAVQCVWEDRQGRIWVGGYLGLYRLDGESFVNLTNALPWN